MARIAGAANRDVRSSESGRETQDMLMKRSSSDKPLMPCVVPVCMCKDNSAAAVSSPDIS